MRGRERERGEIRKLARGQTVQGFIGHNRKSELGQGEEGHWRCNSKEKHLPSMHKALGLTPSTRGEKSEFLSQI
jgi:hypothetical protein